MEFDLNKKFDISNYNINKKQIKLCNDCEFTNNTKCHIFSSNNFLYKKYNLSLVYHYLKKINYIIGDSNKKSNLIFKDHILLLEEEEVYFKRIYFSFEYNKKMKLIIEYYQYNNCNPNLFVKFYGIMIENFNIRKFKVRIKKLIKDGKINTKIDDTKISSIKPDEKSNTKDFKNLSSLKNILEDNNYYINLNEFHEKYKSKKTINNISKIKALKEKKNKEKTLDLISRKLNKIIYKNKKINKEKSGPKPNILYKYRNNSKTKDNIKKLINSTKKEKWIRKIRNNFNNININILFNNKKKSNFSLNNIFKNSKFNKSKIKLKTLKMIKKCKSKSKSKKKHKKIKSCDIKTLKNKSWSTNNSLIFNSFLNFSKNKKLNKFKSFRNNQLKTNNINNIKNSIHLKQNTNFKNLFLKKKKSKLLKNNN